MDRTYDDISFLLDYLPMHFLQNSRCPFVLLVSSFPLGIVRQPSSDSRRFSSDFFPHEYRSEAASRTALYAFPLVKVLFDDRLKLTSDEDVYLLLRSELRKVELKFEEQTTIYDPEDAIQQLATAKVDPREAIVWIHLMNQMASRDIGRRALSFLWNMTGLPEALPTDSRLSTASASQPAYTVALQLSLVGPEYREEIAQTLQILRRYSFVRYFDLDDGKLTVMMHTVVRDLVNFSPFSLPKYKGQGMLLRLAEIGQISVNLDQMMSLRRQIDLLAADNYHRMSKITIDSVDADPEFQRNWSAYRDKLENEVQRLSNHRGECSREVTNVMLGSFNWQVKNEMIGVKAEGNVVAGGNVSVTILPSAHDILDSTTEYRQEQGPLRHVHRRVHFKSNNVFKSRKRK